MPDGLIRSDLLAVIELILFILILCLPHSFLKRIAPCWKKFYFRLEGIARRPKLSILFVGLLAFGGSMFVSLLVRFPEPAVHDEFSYLLAADTFAQGRVTNPPHPLRRHFESIHIIQEPTYASKYPPAQGLVLALGQVTAGHPVVGVWLSIGLACACICWMLQGWVPLRWAFLGGLIAALNLGFFGYWGQKYWGGAMAAAGGALLFGSLRRLMRGPALGVSMLMAIGLLVLANSRPLEGLLVSLPVAVLIFFVFFRSNAQSRRRWITEMVVPICAVCFLGALSMGYLNFQVTGSPLRMPYQVYEDHYPTTPIFLWSKKTYQQDPSIPESFCNLQKISLNWQRDLHTFLGFVIHKTDDFSKVLVFFFRGIFLIPLIMLPRALRNRWNALAFFIVVFNTGVVVLEISSYPRKLAPVTALMVLLVIQCLRYLQASSWRRWLVSNLLTGIFLAILGFSVLISFLPGIQAAPSPPSRLRADLLRQLNKGPDRHVIMVRYGPKHFVHFEWVYNRADIDAAKAIWARELGREENQELFKYFRNRKIWLLEADSWIEGRQVRLVPYRIDGSLTANK